MSSTEDRPTDTGGSSGGPGAGTAEVPPPPAPGDSRRPALMGVIAVLLIVALGLVAGVLALDILDEPAASDATPMPTGATSFTALPTHAGPTPPAGTPTVTPGPGSPALPSPSLSPAAATDEPADPQQRLLSHVPPQLRDTCRLDPGTAPGLATASCEADNGEILATYFLYPDESAMSAAYDGFVATSEIERDSGRCADPATWPSEGQFSVAGQPVGRVLCLQIADAPTLYWTDSRLLILTSAIHLGSDAERLFRFWETEAGPMS